MKKKKYANLLILLQNFENLWNMYSVSEGFLYHDKIKEAARGYLKLFNNVSAEDPKIRNSKELRFNENDNTEHIDEVNKALQEWCDSDKLFPMESDGIMMGDNERSRFLLQPVFMCISAYLLSKLNFDYFPIICKSWSEGSFHSNNVRWNGRFPYRICDQVDSKLLDSLSKSETVVIIGDIRRSQDLITYAVNPNTYRSNMVVLIEKVRNIVLENNGIFDGFTGDGFIFYFNDFLAKKIQKDMYKTVIDVCIKIQHECKPLFEEWKKELRRLPQESIGLSIGIDSGMMHFLDDNIMLAIGSPAVWATRMCAAGEAGDIIVNNIPYTRTSNNQSGYTFDEVYSATKTGEQFKAFKLKYGDV